jgi:hypothetical protein
MVNFDRLFSASFARINATVDSAARRVRTFAANVRDAMNPTVDTVSAAVSPKAKIVNDAVSPKLKVVGDTLSPWMKAFKAASPKVKASCVACALGVVTGIVAPIAVTQSAHDAYAADAVAMARDGKAPTFDQMHPTGIQGSQSDFSMSTGQMRNAQQIIQTGQAMGLPPRAWVIAVATAMQETKLTNFGDLGGANDYDSLGLFQQRPSSGWGSPEQLQDPIYASKAFYTALTQVGGWDQMDLTDAAQAVQVSAFGDRYAQWEAKAGDVVDAFYGQAR